MKRPTGQTVGDTKSISQLFELAKLDSQRPDDIGAGMKILEGLLRLPSFQPDGRTKA
ncbi:hypothetical protein [Deinococcus alpinitundrae]|uniref:hypothetical protein n=1 Tax=Deinococcus alpinitundrae TaxID=468913 RepID=UPI00137A09FD|nr:hypothetical protein [Deinococcus alpinitundrae]